jgi:hypothetical protein
VNIPTFYTPIGGTFSGIDSTPNAVDHWWEKGSDFVNYLYTLNLVIHPSAPFEWDGIIGGIFDPGLRVWNAASRHFQCHVGPLPYHERNFILHSHAGQFGFIAASRGLKIRNLITVGTPVRKDMESYIKLARPNIGAWLHIYDGRCDWVSIAGSLFDRRLKIQRNFPLADRNDDVRAFKTGHSKMLAPPHLDLWRDRKWAEFLAYGINSPVSAV